MIKPLALIRLMRPAHAVKNLFVGVPLFFAGQVGNFPLLINSLLAFLAVTLMASSVYIMNDMADIEVDRRHPKKKHRPLASGEVSPRQALFLALTCFAGSAAVAASVNKQVLFATFFYLCLNGVYSLRLKHVPIIDVTIVASGFVLRVFVGAFATGIAPTMWLVVMTFLLSLFLALAKRRDDVLIFEKTGERMREVIGGYNLRFVDHAISIMAAVVCVAYLQYTISPEVVNRTHAPYLYLTFFFVVIGILRYLQIAFVLNDSGNPTQLLLKDKPLILAVLGWVATFVGVLYF